MDLSFFRHAQTRFASRASARLDYRVLLATLEAMQSVTPAARSMRGLRTEQAPAREQDPLVEILLGEPGWREAVTAQGGCFNRAQAMRMRGRS